MCSKEEEVRAGRSLHGCQYTSSVNECMIAYSLPYNSATLYNDPSRC